MKKKLTIRIEESAIDSAKQMAANQGKSVSQIVEDYLRLAAAGQELRQSAHDVHPEVAAITGMLAGVNLNESDYREHLARKHL